MSVSLYDLSVGSYVQTVGALVGILKKGADYCAGEGIDLDQIVAARLYPDMANFHFQVTSVTHHSLGALNALKSGEFRPPNYDDCDYAALQALTQATLAELNEQKRDEIDALGGKTVTFKMNTMEVPFTAENFVLSFSIPNVFFHATTAYDILRMKGVPLGKLDFMGKMRAGV